MLQQKLIQLVEALQHWQQLAAANPSALQFGDNQRRHAAIAQGLPTLQAVIRRLQAPLQISDDLLVFVYQVLYELRRTAIATGYGRFVQLANYVWEYAQSVKGDAQQVQQACDQQTLKFRNTDLTDVKKWVAQIEQAYNKPLLDHQGDPINEDGALITRIQAEEVQLFYHMTMHLTRQDQTISCTHYDYQLTLEQMVNGRLEKLHYTWTQKA